MRRTVKVPGSCGELVQGFFRGAPILITCPIEKFTTVTISDEFNGVAGLGEKSLAMLRKLHLPKNLGVRLTTELPRGKGMASSSADLAALAKAADFDLSAEKISEMASSIEPTDGTFFSGVVAMNPVTGKLIKNIRVAEKYAVAIFDYGGEIDTLKFNRRSNFQISSLDENLNLEMVEKSALANQEILYKPNLREIISFAKKIGAVTVNVAHSGTVIGIFFHAGDLNIDAKIAEIAARFDFVKFMMKTRLIDGGFYAEI